MREVWSLPGYDVEALLGSGASGEVWRARHHATGEAVALKRLRERADASAVEALRRGAAALRSVDSPYLVRPREIVDSGTATVLVLDFAAGGSLRALLARRGSLGPGEVVTVARPLAQALAAAHRAGLVHGALRPSEVLFTADGMPLLSGLGPARLEGERTDGAAAYADPRGHPDPAGDVWALAALCHHMLAGTPQHRERLLLGQRAPAALRDLVAAVEAGLTADPAARPDAATFASLLGRAHAPGPVRLVGAVPAPVQDVPARRRVPPGLLRGVSLVALLLAGGVGGWLSGRGGEQPPPPAAVTTPVPVDWEQELDRLDAARAQAFANGDVAALAQVYAPGSPGLASDTALLQPLADRRQTAHGLRHDVRSVEVLEQAARSARLRVVDVLTAYEVRNASGAVVGRAGPRGERPFLVSLTRTPSGWRLVEVRPQT